MNYFPNNINPAQWEASQDVARGLCRQIYANGGRPADALTTYGLGENVPYTNWKHAIDQISLLMVRQVSKAA